MYVALAVTAWRMVAVVVVSVSVVVADVEEDGGRGRMLSYLCCVR